MPCAARHRIWGVNNLGKQRHLRRRHPCPCRAMTTEGITHTRRRFSSNGWRHSYRWRATVMKHAPPADAAAAEDDEGEDASPSSA